jgi:hypothetical protein
LLLKTLFALPRCRIAEDDGFGDLLSWSQMHIDERAEVALAAQQRRRQKVKCVGRSWLFVVTRSMVAAFIYREYLTRVITSRNWVGLSLLKCIRHRLIVKINGKRRLRTCEALGQILMDHSHARHALGPARRARVYVSSFLLSSTLLQVHRK